MSSCVAVPGRVGESSLASRIKRVSRRLRARAVVHARRRSLIGEILALQLMVAAVVGALAFGGLWLASSFAVRDDMRAWGAQWLGQLDELAAPAYLADDAERLAQVRTFFERFSEIVLVRYYSRDGATLATQLSGGRKPVMAPLDAAELARLASAPRDSAQHLLDTAAPDIPVVRLARPIWDSPTPAGERPVTSEPIGYVELALDFSRYQAYEIRGMRRALAIGSVVLVLLTAASWVIYRRALLPLAALRAPLERLARGRTDFTVTASGHREIAAVANAVKATASVLDERDGLTGLLNRSSFHALLAAEMESVAASGATSALLYVDLDHFKYVNDSLGEAAGDQLLRVVGDWLCASLRPGDLAARFGGDEFVMLLRNVGNKEAAAMGAELVRRMHRESFSHAGRSVNVRCSIGGTMVRGTRVEPAKVVSRAARACYQAKLNGRHQFCFYNFASKETVEMTADAGWSQKIQRALKEDAFVLHYQPIVSLRTRETAYYEVLLRMHFDDDDLALPATFLPTAARLGLMVDIDRWVISQSLRSLAALRFARGDVRFTLNVSGSTFERSDFFSYLETELRFTGVPLDAIVIEITEQMAMRDLSRVASRMADLAARGCRFAIDDFGSGYCSYSYLKSLPLAFVKIDGSFITNLLEDRVDRKIVTAIVEVAAAAECETIAEHVTDYETLRLLAKLGVVYAQGYFLGKPAARPTATTLPLPTAAASRRLSARRAAVPAARRVAQRRAAGGGEARLDSSEI
jgi:diguanylate cyclase (GGDEF)-like protein